MTLPEFMTTLRHLVSEAQSKGHTSMVLSVERSGYRRPRRSPNIAIARGLIGRWMGDLQDRDGYIVDVQVSDAVAWLRRREAAMGQAGEAATCQHATTVRGKDSPRVYGSWRTEVCTACGAFRTHGHDVGRSQMSEWRLADHYAAATAPSEDE